MGMYQADFVFPAEDQDMNELADQEERDQQQLQTISFQVLNDAPVIGKAFTGRQEIAETVNQDAIHVFFAVRAGIMRYKGNNTVFPAELLAEVMHKPGLGVVFPTGVG